MMAYEFEADEWRRATYQLTECDRNDINIELCTAAGLNGYAEADDDRY